MAKTVLSRVAFVLALLLTATNLFSAELSGRSTAAVPRFGTADVELRSTAVYNGSSGTPNPFDVALTAQVTAPSGRRYTVDGFFDGDGAGGQTGNVFKFRVFADEVGTWRWTTSSGAPGLNGLSGTFSCSGTLAGAFGRGPIVENPANLRTLQFREGEPVYLIAKFLDSAAPNPIKYSHTLFSEKLTDSNRQALLTRHLGMKLNKVNVYLANRGDYDGVSTTPWVGTASANDKARFDLKRWKTYETWVVKMRDAGVVSQLWFFADDSSFGNLPDADRRRLVQYGMARLSGYANTMFTLVLEWQEGWSSSAVNSHMGFLHQKNPWARLATVHGTTGNFSFPSASWADYMDIQSGNSAGHPTIHAMGLAHRLLAAKPLIQEEFALGAEDTAGRQKAWAAFTAGAAGSGTGAYLQHLANFVGRLDFERMAPADKLVLSGNGYALAEAGRAYVFYLYNGGTLRADLTALSGTLTAEWYDPRTGASRSAPAAAGGAVRTYTAPASGDWVLYLHR